MYSYQGYQWLVFFYIYCFLGWVFESTYVSLKKRRFVNRGFLRSPMLPLYGFGAVLMLWTTIPVRDNLFLVYWVGVIAATALEYVTGFLMEQIFKVRYWDYSNQKFQLGGYICLSSSLAWGGLTLLMTEIIHEPISRAVLSTNQTILIVGVLLITVLFVADTLESVREALSLGKALETMTKLRGEIEELQSRISVLREQAVEHVSAVREEAHEILSSARDEASEQLSLLRDEAGEQLSLLRDEAGEQLSLLRDEAGERIASLTKQLEDAKRDGSPFIPKAGCGISTAGACSREIQVPSPPDSPLLLRN